MNLSQLLSDWIKKIENENPPPASIAALNFGMLQSDKGYMVYVTGAELYDADDDDWAGEIDYQPSRQNKYVTLPRELTAGLKWRGVLDLVANTLKEIAGAQPDRLLFNGRALTASFDDGDLIMVKAE